MGPKRALKPRFDIKVSLANANGGRTIVEYRTSQSVFVQGDPIAPDFLVFAFCKKERTPIGANTISWTFHKPEFRS
jgi:hypothetical protein